MFVRPCYRNKGGKRHAYWALVESYRTARGPRQRVVAYLGNLDEEDREACARRRRVLNEARTALVDLLGVPERCVNDDRLYRALDALLPHKRRLESYLKERMGELFKLSYDLLLYDVTSTYCEGEMAGNPQAQRGYSRDKRPDCKQVCIGLVVSRCGMSLGYEVFEGNRHDSKTLQEMVVEIESRYGRADRIWVLDRGMISEKKIEFLKQEGRRYIVGTPRSQLKAYQQELLEGGWEEVHEGLEVQLCRPPMGRSPLFCVGVLNAARRKRRCMSASRCVLKKALENWKPRAAATDNNR